MMKMMISKFFCLSLSLLVLLGPFSSEVSATYTWQMYQRVEDYATGDIKPYKFYNNCWWFKVPANGNNKPFFRLAASPTSSSSSSSSTGGGGGNGNNGNSKGSTNSQANTNANSNTKAQTSRPGGSASYFFIKGQLPPIGTQNRPTKGGDSNSQQPIRGNANGKGETPGARTKGGVDAENPSYKGESIPQPPRGKGGKGENMPPRKGGETNYPSSTSRRDGQKGFENRGPNPNKYNDDMNQYSEQPMEDDMVDDRSSRNTRSIDEEYVTSRPLKDMLYDVSSYMMMKKRR